MRLLKDNWVFLVLSAALTAAFALVVYGPQQCRLDEARTSIAKADVAIETDELSAARVPQMRAQVDRLKAEFQDFDRRLPRQQELAEFLREISALARTGRFREQTIEPGSPTSGALYDCLPIRMRFDCTFMDLAGFLHQLTRMTRLSRVERIHLRPDVRQSDLLHVEMQINIYFTES